MADEAGNNGFPRRDSLAATIALGHHLVRQAIEHMDWRKATVGKT